MTNRTTLLVFVLAAGRPPAMVGDPAPGPHGATISASAAELPSCRVQPV